MEVDRKGERGINEERRKEGRIKRGIKGREEGEKER